MGIIAYRLALPPSLSGVYEVFHVSMLWKCTPDPTHVVDWGGIIVNTDGTSEEGPTRILDSRESGFTTQDHEATESVVVTLRSGGGNMGTRGHDSSHLSFPI